MWMALDSKSNRCKHRSSFSCKKLALRKIINKIGSWTVFETFRIITCLFIFFNPASFSRLCTIGTRMVCVAQVYADPARKELFTNKFPKLTATVC